MLHLLKSNNCSKEGTMPRGKGRDSRGNGGKPSEDELDNLIEKWEYFFKHAEETSETGLVRIVGSDQVIYRAYEG
jgi:hypothetical protein